MRTFGAAKPPKTSATGVLRLAGPKFEYSGPGTNHADRLMDVLTIALIVIVLWLSISLLVAVALGRASRKADESSERLLAADRLGPRIETTHQTTAEPDPLDVLAEELERSHVEVRDPAAQSGAEVTPVPKRIWKGPLHRPRPYRLRKLLH
jgi:hypothetical protein